MEIAKTNRMIKQLSILLCMYLLSPCLVLSQQIVPVIVSEAKVDTFFDRVEALGTLKAYESVYITATVTDTITRVNFDDGQRVEVGDILVEMTNSEEHALLEEELSNLHEAEKQLERTKLLVNKKGATQALLDQQKRDVETAQARLLQIESKLKDRLIVAPFTGVVGLRNISVGALVEPGDVITTLDDDRMMKLDFTLPATYLDSIAPGLTIKARSTSYGDRIFSGKISSLDSRVDVASRSITARAILENSDRVLKPGMLMTVQLLKNQRETVVVPEEAIIPIGNSSFVYLINKESSPPSAEKRPVSTGGRRVGEVEIVEGITPGDLVVVHGAIRLRPRSQVKIVALDDGTKSLGEMLRTYGEGKSNDTL